VDADGQSDIGNQVTFTGRRFDSESGLYYFRNRYVHAQLGRFVSRDPSGYVDGMSLYAAYFLLNGTDPMGLWEWPWSPNASWDLRENLNAWSDNFHNNLNYVSGGFLPGADEVNSWTGPAIGMSPNPVAVFDGAVAGIRRMGYENVANEIDDLMTSPPGYAIGIVPGMPRGMKLHRNFGGKSKLNSESWTDVCPSKQSRNSLGLGEWNTGEFQAHGTLIDNTGAFSLPGGARPYGRYSGGASEIIVPNPARQIRLDAVTMPDNPLQ
jgi:RHS repeat-associated protein